MRIVVFSDSHRMESRVLDIIEKNMENADLFIFLGDGNSDVDTALMIYKNIRIERVNGNNDFYSSYPTSKIITCAGKKILLTHGHPYYVKHGLEDLEREARSNKVDICLFGHTHNPYCNYKDGIHYLNPGAACKGEYGIIDIVDNGIMSFCNKL